MSKILLTKVVSPFGASTNIFKAFTKNYPEISQLEVQETHLYFLGFSKKKLSDTLFHSSSINNALEVAKKSKANFVLIIPEKINPNLKVVVDFAKHYSLVNQYSVKVFLLSQSALYNKSARLALWLSKLLVLILILPWSVVSLQAALAYRLVKCGFNSLSSTEWERAFICAKSSEFIAKGLEFQLPFVIGLSPLLVAIDHPAPVLINLVLDSAYNIKSMATLGQEVYPYLTKLLSSDSPPSLIPESQLMDSLTSVSDSLSRLRITVSNIPSGSPLVSIFKGWATPEYLETARAILGNISKLTSQNGTTKYIVAIQDPSRLTPSGGQIDIFLLVTLENGRLTDTTLISSSKIMSNLSGSPLPPESFIKQGSLLEWGASFSSWHTSPKESADQVVTFFKSSSDESVSGVFLVNLGLFEKILEVTGPVGAITSQNFLSQYHSKEPSDFLRSYLSEQGKILSSLPKSRSLIVLEKVFSSFLDGNSLFVPSSNQLQLLNELGKLPTQKSCTPPLCYLSELKITDTYLSSTPQPQIHSIQTNEIVISQASISEIITTTYTNSSAKPLSILVRSEPSSQNESKEILVPAGSMASIVQSKNSSIHPTTSFRYYLNYQNQPGSSKKLVLKVSYPPSWSIGSNLKPEIATKGQLEYNYTLDRPFSLALDISTHE